MRQALRDSCFLKEDEEKEGASTRALTPSVFLRQSLLSLPAASNTSPSPSGGAWCACVSSPSSAWPWRCLLWSHVSSPCGRTAT